MAIPRPKPTNPRGSQPSPRVFARLTAPLRPLPNLLVIGAQKAGTTSLHELLGAHPEICMSKVKECGELVRDAPSALRYRAFFPWRGAAVARRARWFGESTPFYAFHPAAPARAAELLREPRAIMVLRDPIERAWSHHRHAVRLGLEDLEFDEAIAREPERIGSSEHSFRHHSYVARGCYAGQLQRWFDALGRDRVLAVDFTEIVDGSGRATREIERFLGLRSPLPAEPPRMNAAAEVGAASGTIGEPRAESMSEPTRALLRVRLAPEVAAVEALLGRRFERWTSTRGG